MTVNAEKFEELLSAELKATLDAERGKALAAFRGYVAAEEAGGRRGNGGEDGGAYQADFKKSRRGSGQISRREAWMWTAAPSLAAACLGVVLTLQAVGGRNGGHAVGPVNAPGGEVATSGPKDTLEWVDPSDHAVYRLTEPTENVGYQELKPF